MIDWPELLDEFEARLEHCRFLLQAATETGAAGAGPDTAVGLDTAGFDGFDLGAWPPPGATTEPLPARYEGRARRCLERAAELQRAIEARRDELPALRPATRNRRASGFSSLSTHL